MIDLPIPQEDEPAADSGEDIVPGEARLLPAAETEIAHRLRHDQPVAGLEVEGEAGGGRALGGQDHLVVQDRCTAAAFADLQHDALGAAWRRERSDRAVDLDHDLNLAPSLRGKRSELGREKEQAVVGTPLIQGVDLEGAAVLDADHVLLVPGVVDTPADGGPAASGPDESTPAGKIPIAQAVPA